MVVISDIEANIHTSIEAATGYQLTIINSLVVVITIIFSKFVLIF